MPGYTDTVVLRNILFGTVGLERDSWVGDYRFWDLGSVLVPEFEIWFI